MKLLHLAFYDPSVALWPLVIGFGCRYEGGLRSLCIQPFREMRAVCQPKRLIKTNDRPDLLCEV